MIPFSLLFLLFWAQTLPAPLEGRKIFLQKGCIRCHSIWGVGGKGGPDLARIQGRTLSDVAALMWNHSVQMVEKMEKHSIPFPEFTEEEMRSLLRYLAFVRYFDQPGDFERGEKLFQEKQCIQCHSIAGKGGNIGPALDKYSSEMSPIFLASAMWNHGLKMSEKMKEKGIPRPQFEGTDVADLLNFIRGSSLATEPGRMYLTPGDPERGKQIFRQKRCIFCHSIHGEGGKVGPDLGSLRLKHGVSQIVGRMWNHADKMWAKMQELNIPQPELSPEEMADLFAFLYEVGFFELPGNKELGKKILSEKKCLSCHALAGKSEGFAPDLSRIPALKSTYAFATAMWNHSAKMGKLFKQRNIPFPVFREGEMVHLQEYLKSLRPPQSIQTTSP
ncbi:MAG: c-type cytochrome [bacterium JZ-2024 1]